VTATELGTQTRAQVVVKPTYGMSDADITRMLRESLDHAGEDAQARILAEQKVEAQRLLEATRTALNQDGAILLDDAELAALLQALRQLEQAVAGRDGHALEGARQALERLTDGYAARRMDHAIRARWPDVIVQDIGG